MQIIYNLYVVIMTQEFPKLLQQQDPLLPNEEYVPYDVQSLFTNVPIQETIDYILMRYMLRTSWLKFAQS